MQEKLNQQSENWSKILEVEQGLLGCLLRVPSLYHKNSKYIYDGMFVSDKHNTLVSALISFYATGSDNSDPIILSNNSDMSISEIKHLKYHTGQDESFFRYIELCEQYRKNHSMALLGQQLLDIDLIDDDPDSAIAFALEQVNKISYVRQLDDGSLKDISKDVLDRMDRAIRGEAIGIRTGFASLNNMMNYYYPKDLIIVGGRPHMGKTKFMISTARKIAIEKKPILILSLEQGRDQILEIFASIQSNIPLKKIKGGMLNEYEYKEFVASINSCSDLPVFVSDAMFSISEIENSVRYYKSKYGIEMVFIDYMQLANSPEHKDRRLEIGDISRRLKRLCKETGLPIFCLSQLSRSVETRGGDKRPLMSDLRETGDIEQDADVIMFLYRPAYYDLESIEDPDGKLIEVIIRKCRGGDLGTANLMFQGQDIVDWEDEPYVPPEMIDNSVNVKPVVEIPEEFDKDNDMFFDHDA